jgi:hypothetical protein
MANPENIESFLSENKKLLSDYIDIKLEMYKLRFIAYFSRSAGYIIWFIVSIFLLFLFLVFLGLLTGFWLSDITGSYTMGFGLTALVMLIVIIIVALLRKTLFVRPVIHMLIKNLSIDKTAEK